MRHLRIRGVTLVFTDGSSAVEDQVGQLAGYGIFFENEVAIAAYVPDHLHQTNNSAELFAALIALHIFTTGEIAICTDSQCVWEQLELPDNGN